MTEDEILLGNWKDLFLEGDTPILKSSLIKNTQEGSYNGQEV